jgi:hypothetical protein
MWVMARPEGGGKEEPAESRLKFNYRAAQPNKQGEAEA